LVSAVLATPLFAPRREAVEDVVVDAAEGAVAHQDDRVALACDFDETACDGVDRCRGLRSAAFSPNRVDDGGHGELFVFGDLGTADGGQQSEVGGPKCVWISGLMPLPR